MKDIFGIEIQVGATVAFNPPAYKGLNIGTVIGLTPKMVKIEYNWVGRLDDKRTTHMLPRDVVVKPN